MAKPKPKKCWKGLEDCPYIPQGRGDYEVCTRCGNMRWVPPPKKEGADGR